MLEFFRRRSRDRFAHQALQAIIAAGGPADFVYDRDAFLLRLPDAVANLTNVFAAYHEARGAQRRLIFENFVTMLTQGGQSDLASYEAVESKLVAIVRERSFLASMQGLVWD